MQRVLKYKLEEKLDESNLYVTCNPELQVRLVSKSISCPLMPHGATEGRWAEFNGDRVRVKKLLSKGMCIHFFKRK